MRTYVAHTALGTIAALALGACVDRTTVTAPTAPDLVRGDGANGNPTGDVYVQTNDAR